MSNTEKTIEAGKVYVVRGFQGATNYLPTFALCRASGPKRATIAYRLDSGEWGKGHHTSPCRSMWSEVSLEKVEEFERRLADVWRRLLCEFPDDCRARWAALRHYGPKIAAEVLGDGFTAPAIDLAA